MSMAHQLDLMASPGWLVVAASIAVFFAQTFVLTQTLGILRRHLGLLGNRPHPLAERRKPDPQIRCNLPQDLPLVCAIRTASSLNASLCIAAHIRRTHGPTLDGEYCSQKMGYCNF